MNEEKDIFDSLLLKFLPNPVAVVSPDTSIIYINQALEKLTGYDSQEILGKTVPYPWWERENEKQFQKKINYFKKYVHHLITTGKTMRYPERSLITKDGKKLYIEVNSIALSLMNSKYLVSIWIDVTKRKEFENEVTRVTTELRNLSAHLFSAREKERAKIALQVHDEFGQALTALRINTCWLRNKLNKERLIRSSKAAQQIDEALDSMTGLIDGTLEEAKTLSRELRPMMLDAVGLPATIERVAQEWEEKTGIVCKVLMDLEGKLEQDLSTTIFRVIQEALRNVYHHSNATTVTIILRQKPKSIILEVSDNGRGITQDQISSSKAFGLITIREQVRLLGGTTNIRGHKGKGTTLEVKIPIKR